MKFYLASCIKFFTEKDVSWLQVVALVVMATLDVSLPVWVGVGLLVLIINAVLDALADEVRRVK